jgi:5-methylthioadenosine/S-adenosylhomocysteine deaminase
MEADILIKGGLVLTLDPAMKIYDKADVEISGSKISAITPHSNQPADKIIDAVGKLVMPGLINCHTHAAMVMMRGLADDMPLDIWWQKFIFPIEKKLLNPEFIRIGVGLAAIEMIKSGTTAFADMYFFEDAAAEVISQIGLRCWLGEGVLDQPTPDSSSADLALKKTEELYYKYEKDDLINISVAPHATYSCSEECLKRCRALADKMNLPVHIHVAETAGEVADFKRKYGKSPVEYLDSIGFLNERTQAVHCVHLSHKDMQILAQRKVKVVHCQESNMKLASGSAPVVELQDLGVAVGLGTDGAASNNNLDMFDEMDSVAKVHKLVRNDPTVMNAETVVKMATIDSAKVLLADKMIGSLEVGKRADIIILDLNRPHLVPLYNIYSQLVYSAGGSEVDSVIVNGKLIMENRTILTVNEKEIMDQARELAGRIKNELKI